MEKFYVDYPRNYGNGIIVSATLVKETDKQAVLIVGGREIRMRKDGHVFDSYDDAKKYIISVYEERVKKAENSLWYHRGELEKTITIL